MAKLKNTDENSVKKIVKKWFDDRGAFSYAPQQGGMGRSGIPDRVGCIPMVVTQEMVGQKIGVFVAIEAKAPGRRGQKFAGVSELQKECLLDINDARGIAYVVDSSVDLLMTELMMAHIQNKVDGLGYIEVTKLLEKRIKHNG